MYTDSWTWCHAPLVPQRCHVKVGNQSQLVSKHKTVCTCQLVTEMVRGIV